MAKFILLTGAGQTFTHEFHRGVAVGAGSGIASRLMGALAGTVPCISPNRGGLGNCTYL